MSINNEPNESIKEWCNNTTREPTTPASFRSIGSGGTGFTCPSCQGSFTVEVKPDVLRETQEETYETANPRFQNTQPMGIQTYDNNGNFSCPWSTASCPSCRIGDRYSTLGNVTGFSNDFLHQVCSPEYSNFYGSCYSTPIKYNYNNLPKDFKLEPIKPRIISKLKSYITKK